MSSSTTATAPAAPASVRRAISLRRLASIHADEDTHYVIRQQSLEASPQSPVDSPRAASAAPAGSVTQGLCFMAADLSLASRPETAHTDTAEQRNLLLQDFEISNLIKLGVIQKSDILHKYTQVQLDILSYLYLVMEIDFTATSSALGQGEPTPEKVEQNKEAAKAMLAKVLKFSPEEAQGAEAVLAKDDAKMERRLGRIKSEDLKEAPASTKKFKDGIPITMKAFTDLLSSHAETLDPKDKESFHDSYSTLLKEIEGLLFFMADVRAQEEACTIEPAANLKHQDEAILAALAALQKGDQAHALTLLEQKQPSKTPALSNSKEMRKNTKIFPEKMAVLRKLLQSHAEVLGKEKGDEFLNQCNEHTMAIASAFHFCEMHCVSLISSNKATHKLIAANNEIMRQASLALQRKDINWAQALLMGDKNYLLK